MTTITDLNTGEVVSAPFVRPAWHRERLAISLCQGSKTHQAHKSSCDINNIIRQFDRTGLLPPVTKPAVYEDVTNLQRPLDELLAESSRIRERVKAAKSEADRVRAEKEAADKAAFEAFKKAQLDLPVIPPTPPTPPTAV